MHSLTIGNYTANFNGDFSGDIIVIKDDGKSVDSARRVAEIPFMVMLAIVGEKLRREKIAELENMPPMDMIYPGTTE